MNYQNNKTETSVIQLALKRAGFLDGEIDGIFGSDTRNAVIAFQKAASLSPDGIVGPKTYAALLPYLKGYTIHRVKKGDSLYSIAAMHNTSIRKIMLANPTVDPLNLQIGTILTVPFAFSVVPTDVPYSYMLLTYICEGLLMRYPFLSGGVIGKSVMGKKHTVSKHRSGQRRGILQRVAPRKRMDNNSPTFKIHRRIFGKLCKRRLAVRYSRGTVI